MERKNYMMRMLLTALAITLIIAFVLPVNGQTLNSTGNVSVAGGQNSGAELTSGFWILTDKKTDLYNRANVTKWTGSEQNLQALCQWVDILNIEHTISNGFQWEDLPKQMAPGKDMKLALEYVNDEYSTTNRVLTGIDVKIDNVGADYITSSKDGIDVGRLVKDNKNYNTEKKTVFFNAPRTLLGETNQMQIMVDCFIGQDHYVTAYTYTWNGDVSASK